MRWQVEITDTFGGQANYSWVERYVLEDNGLTEIQLVRRAKALVGLNGVRGTGHWFGDMYEFRPYGYCQVMFIGIIDDDE